MSGGELKVVVTAQWRRKLFALFFSGPLWRRYLVIYSFVALAGACLFGPDLLTWSLQRPAFQAWKLITSIFLLAGFAFLVAFCSLFRVNRVTQASVFIGALLGLLLRARKKREGTSSPRGSGPGAFFLLPSLDRGTRFGEGPTPAPAPPVPPASPEN